MILPLLDYCDVIYDSCMMYESENLDKLQRKANFYYVLVHSGSPAMENYS